MHDFESEPAALRSAMASAAQRVLASGRYILGTEVAAFEAKWASLCGVRHAIGVGNGMDALEICLRAVGIGPGDEVIVPAMTAFASALAVLRAGAEPVLADIDPDNALLSPASAARCVSARTKAVMVVHLYGQVGNMESWMRFCRTRGIELIEDCAQSHLARSGGRPAGAFGRAAGFSFYPTKNLGAPGDGGMVVCDDPEVALVAARLRNYGQSERFWHPMLGLNSRLDEIQAAVLLERVAWLESFNERRRQIARRYDVSLRNPSVTLLATPPDDASHVHHLYVVRCEARESLQAHLSSCGVDCSVHYPLPIHFQPPGTRLRRDPEGLAACERHAASCLSLPCHPQLSDEQVACVVESVNSFRA
jgi:dTDP-4-amino-4,6-dideoxygalactose transaminase